ncbi:hypothetical protein [Clostridium sp. DJ247]|uniref:hypothetical protein n=1 Tax=Clostridium sp. DJ247 TaxID=2726188 RepID=UPI0037BE8C42
MVSYFASEKRYEDMKYNRCGNSGLKLPAISLGLWHNFGGVNAFEKNGNLSISLYPNLLDIKIH